MRDLPMPSAGLDSACTGESIFPRAIGINHEFGELFFKKRGKGSDSAAWQPAPPGRTQILRNQCPR